MAVFKRISKSEPPLKNCNFEIKLNDFGPVRKLFSDMILYYLFLYLNAVPVRRTE